MALVHCESIKNNPIEVFLCGDIPINWSQSQFVIKHILQQCSPSLAVWPRKQIQAEKEEEKYQIQTSEK